MLKSKGIKQYQAADKAGMSQRSAHKYLKSNKLPSQMQKEHNWRTRKAPFEDDWPEICGMLEVNSGLEAKTVFEYYQREYPGRYEEGQLRTLQRRMKIWRATQGPAKELYFQQIHYSGDLCASDFTHMNNLEITIRREPFNHLLYHFVLTYSNWETITICYSESFESLSAGLQNAFWELGGIPKRHRTDRMSAAVNKACNPEKFTRNYQALLRHYKIEAERTNARCANENGDVESSHRHFKRVVSQALMLRGSKDFNSIADYDLFLRKLCYQRNAGRSKRFEEEMETLGSLPIARFDDCKRIEVKVGKSSTIHLQHNTYSVHSRLIGERIQARIYVDYIEIWYAQKMLERIPRLRGESKHCINYRHIIDWLVRKPGAFENYRYQSDLFPSSWFRMTYDWLRSNMPLQANRQYVKILYYAAKEGQTITENIIRHLLEQGLEPNAENVKAQMDKKQQLPSVTNVEITNNEINLYDDLLEQVACYG